MTEVYATYDHAGDCVTMVKQRQRIEQLTALLIDAASFIGRDAPERERDGLMERLNAALPEPDRS